MTFYPITFNDTHFMTSYFAAFPSLTSISNVFSLVSHVWNKVSPLWEEVILVRQLHPDWFSALSFKPLMDEKGLMMQ